MYQPRSNDPPAETAGYHGNQISSYDLYSNEGRLHLRMLQLSLLLFFLSTMKSMTILAVLLLAGHAAGQMGAGPAVAADGSDIVLTANNFYAQRCVSEGKKGGKRGGF